MNEEWRKVAVAPNYEVSNLGQVRRKNGWSGHEALGHVIKIQCDRDGYLKVDLSVFPGKKKLKSFFVHTLVAAAFIGPRPDGTQCHHHDSNPGNNRVTNLYYITPRENVLRSVLERPRRKLSAEQVRAIRQEYRDSAVTTTEIAARCGVSYPTLRNALRDNDWKDVEPLPEEVLRAHRRRFAHKLADRPRRPSRWKLTAERVAEIRRDYIPRTMSQRQLARRYGVSKTAVLLALHGKTWARLLYE